MAAMAGLVPKHFLWQAENGIATIRLDQSNAISIHISISYRSGQLLLGMGRRRRWPPRGKLTKHGYADDRRDAHEITRAMLADRHGGPHIENSTVH